MAKKIIHDPYDRFKGWLLEHHITYADLAELLGINIATVSAKINGTSDFLLSEIKLIKSNYKLPSDIFFASEVA